MIATLLSLLLCQTPATQEPAPPPPAAQEPAQQDPPRSREDRLEGRVAGGEPAEPAPQAPVAPPAAPEAPPGDGRNWKPLNRVALIVNEELVTFREILRAVQTSQQRQEKPGPVQEALELEVVRKAKEMLEIQGGKDLGFDPEQVDRIVRRFLEEEAEKAGSVTQLAADLKRDDVDSFMRKDEAYTYVNTHLWEESITGRAPGPAGRVFRDRFPRPGRVLFEARDTLEMQARNPAVEMTQLILALPNPLPPGGEERVAERLAELRERVVQGEDMGELASLHGALQAARGASGPIPLSSLRRTNPEVARFLEGAREGELSPVLPYLQDGVKVGLIVVRPDRIGAKDQPSFDDPEGQRYLFEIHRQRKDEMRMQVGLGQLLGAAYVWPPETFGGPPPEPAGR